MTAWQERLDQIKAGQAVKPAVVEIFRLPDIVDWEPGLVRTKWVVDPDFFTIGGQLFGGYIGALADQVLGHTAMSVLDDDSIFRTVQMNLSFYLPIRTGTVWITGRVVHRSRQAIHVAIDFCDDDGTLMCAASGVQFIVPISTMSKRAATE